MPSDQKERGEGRLAIVAALKEEVMPLLDQLEVSSPEQKRVPKSDTLGLLVPGRLSGVPVVVAVVGDGVQQAVPGFVALLRLFDVRSVLIAGFAGGLSPDLRLGDLVLGDRVGAPRRDWLVPFLGAPADLYRGGVFSAPRLVSTVSEKASLFRNTFEGSGTAVVDLESHALAALAERRQIPWQVLRVVTDPASEELPRMLAEAARGDGSIRQDVLVFRALTRPWLWQRLLSLKRKAETCALALSDACSRLATDPRWQQVRLSPTKTPQPDSNPAPSEPASDDHARSNRLSTESADKRRLEVL